MFRGRVLLALPLLLVLSVLGVPSGGVAPAGAAARPVITLNVVSNRADLVSGGDALVEVVLPARARPASLVVRLGDRRITHRFVRRADGRYLGLVRGLALGQNVVRAAVRVRGGAVARGRSTITNHRNGGPVFAGPQTRHYVCQESAVDRSCNQPATYTLLYKSSNPLKPGLRPYDRANPPADVATTTTDRGVSVPFIVREEMGYQARDQYKILTLFQPGRTWRPWAPQRQWNHKVLVTHGGSCGASMTPGEAPVDDLSGTLPGLPGIESTYLAALGRGFAVMSTALDNTGHNCNLVTAAESLMMAKERLIEQYGEIRYTIGSGCSGGSITAQTVANAYPGIYQGIVTMCTYPDAMSTAAQFADLHLLRAYFEDPSQWAPGVVWLPTQYGDVEGHLTHLNAVTSDELFFKAAVNPSEPCPGSRPTVAGDRSTLYDADTNPGGVRCSVPEMLKNALGARPESVWSAAEREVGHGFAGLPVGNEGIMYGLRALEAGRITPAQFVDLNAKVGGLGIDGQAIPERIRGDLGSVRNAYRSGAINEFQNVADIPIINVGGPDPGLAHDYAHAYWAERRLQRSQGHTDNRVMWFGVTPLIGDLRWSVESFTAMDRWLSAIERDHRAIPLATKVVQARPADVTDRCANVPGIEAVSGPDGPLCQLPLVQTVLGSPRESAGAPSYNDHNACLRVPLDRTAIGATFSDQQWATLEQVFATGVCDWTRPGFGAGQRNLTWLTYGNASTPVYGGRELPTRPARSMTGWTSRSFAPMLNR